MTAERAVDIEPRQARALVALATRDQSTLPTGVDPADPHEVFERMVRRGEWHSRIHAGHHVLQRRLPEYSDGTNSDPTRRRP